MGWFPYEGEEKGMPCVIRCEVCDAPAAYGNIATTETRTPEGISLGFTLRIGRYCSTCGHGRHCFPLPFSTTHTSDIPQSYDSY